MQELNFDGLADAEMAKLALVSENRNIDERLKRNELEDGSPRGSERFENWRASAVARKLANQDRIKAIGLWIKNHHRSRKKATRCFDELTKNAKNALYELIDHCTALTAENDRLKEVVADSPVTK